MPAKTQASTGENEVILTRIFDAPRELVFKAWTDPKQLAQWWGPKPFTSPICEVDLRPGGAYRIVMRSSEGAEYPMKGVYLEIDAPRRLVMTADVSGHPADWYDMLNNFRGTDRSNRKLDMVFAVSFDQQGEKTKLTVIMRTANNADRDALLKMGAAEGWSQSFDRLDEIVAKR